MMLCMICFIDVALSRRSSSSSASSASSASSDDSSDSYEQACFDDCFGDCKRPCFKENCKGLKGQAKMSCKRECRESCRMQCIMVCDDTGPPPPPPPDTIDCNNQHTEDYNIGGNTDPLNPQDAINICTEVFDANGNRLPNAPAFTDNMTLLCDNGQLVGVFFNLIGNSTVTTIYGQLSGTFIQVFSNVTPANAVVQIENQAPGLVISVNGMNFSCHGGSILNPSEALTFTYENLTGIDGNDFSDNSPPGQFNVLKVLQFSVVSPTITPP